MFHLPILNRNLVPILMFLLVLTLTSCGPTTFVIIEINVTTSPPATQFVESDEPTPEPSPTSMQIEKPLYVTWNVTPKCTNDTLKEVAIKLIISGGRHPYEISPKNEFSLSAGQIKEVKVTSEDGQEWVGKVKAP